MESARRRRRRTRAPCSWRPRLPSSSMTARIRSLPATNPRRSPANSTEIVPGTICQKLPIAMQPAMSVDPIPVPKTRVRRRCRCASRCRRRRSPARSSLPRRARCARSRRDPGRRTSRLVLGPSSFSVFCSSAERVSLAGMKWSATRTIFSGSKTRSPIFASSRAGERPAEIVRHDDVAAHHREVAGREVVGLRVREQDLLGERVSHQPARTGCVSRNATTASPNSAVVALPPRSGVGTSRRAASTASSSNCASEGRPRP